MLKYYDLSKPQTLKRYTSLKHPGTILLQEDDSIYFASKVSSHTKEHMLELSLSHLYLLWP